METILLFLRHSRRYIFFNGEGITARQGHARCFIKIEALGLVEMREIWGGGGGGIIMQSLLTVSITTQTVEYLQLEGPGLHNHSL